jgi:hypothetical protein
MEQKIGNSDTFIQPTASTEMPMATSAMNMGIPECTLSLPRLNEASEDLAKRGFGLGFQLVYPPTGNPPRVWTS